MNPGGVTIFEAGEGGIEVVLLTSESAGRWVESGASPADPGQEEAKVRELLLAVPEAMLLVAQVDEHPLAHLHLCPVGAYGLGIFAMSFWSGFDDVAVAIDVAEALIACCKAIARTLPGVRYLETDIPVSLPEAYVWRMAFERQGVEAVAESYNHVLTIQPSQHVDHDDKIQLRRFSEMPPTEMLSLYQAVYRDSGDRAHLSSLEPFDVRLERLTTMPLLQPDTSAWLIAVKDDRPVGLVFASMQDTAYADPTTGWIVELGVVPEWRRHGLGRTLLQAGLASLTAQGAKQVISRIDACNRPSLQLHAAMGFVRQPDISWLYRWVLAPSEP